MRKYLMLAIGLLVVASMILAACNPVEPTVVPTEEPVGPVTTRTGGWLDEIVVSVVPKDSAVTQLQADAIDVYASGLSSSGLASIQEAGLGYTKQNGLYYDILCNPATFTNGVFNPFTNRKIREALNWVVDRDYINQEVYLGGALAKYLPITTQFPDYADLADIARKLEAKYAYNPSHADEVIMAEMEAMGATKNADGKYALADGTLVNLIFLIRSDSDGTRLPIGDYVSDQLESIGFTVTRQYGKSSELGPIWQGEAVQGLWHLYTAAWSATIIDRDQSNMFQEMYLPESLQGLDSWYQNVPDPAFSQCGNDLAYARYTDLAQRREWMSTCLELSLQDSMQVWLIDGKNYSPYQTDVQVTYDLAAGVEGAQVWPFTVRYVGQEGGTLRWATNDLFTQPWNPVAGSNWAWDQAIIRATSSGDTMNDPYTGLVWPLRIERAEVFLVEGTPAGKTLDWVDLQFVSEIVVPEDAIADWDATTQTFITVGEKFPDGVTAKRKAVTYYPADLFQTVKWHDGSPLSLGDMMMVWAMFFDRAKPESALFDEVYAANFEAAMVTFKGFRITSTDPLVYEVYSDTFNQDAELNVGGLWPTYNYGEGGWPMVAVGNLAEAAGEIAWSQDKADGLEIEQTNFVGGPSLEILSTYLDQAIAENYIPYAPALSQYITAEEAAARYAAVKAFYEAHGHFWIATGPYYVETPYPVEKTLVLKNFVDYPDYADRWSAFGEPKIAVVTVDGEGQITIGSEATFTVFVNYADAAYPQDEIKFVKYLLYDATGEIVTVDFATAVADGQYTITLPAEVTGALAAGANKLEVAVGPYTVAIPTFATFEFVTAP